MHVQSEQQILINLLHKSFALPAGKKGSYRVAQWDDYTHLHRNQFLNRPPLTLTLQARVNAKSLPGTWGFGFWNDPFSLDIGVKGSRLRLPALPETIWFFYGSPKNDLSFRSVESKNGLLASVFTSTSIPSILLPLGLPALPLLACKPTARCLRRLVSRFIREDSIPLNVDVTRWHTYKLEWLSESVRFTLDDDIAFTSTLSPKPPLGLVIWIDNQYASFSADGTVRFGTQENTGDSCMEIKDLLLNRM